MVDLNFPVLAIESMDLYVMGYYDQNGHAVFERVPLPRPTLMAPGGAEKLKVLLSAKALGFDWVGFDDHWVDFELYTAIMPGDTVTVVPEFNLQREEIQ